MFLETLERTERCDECCLKGYVETVGARRDRLLYPGFYIVLKLERQ